MKAVASRESEWIARFGTPSILDDPNRVLPGQGNREDHINSLSLYATLIPFLVPPLQEQKRPVLWHPDLHGSNIFIRPSEEGKVSPSIPISLTSIIDWQGSWIGPAFLQLKVPPLYYMDGVPPGKQLPSLPDHFDSLSDREKEKEKKMHQRRIHHKLFEAAAFPHSILTMAAREERVYLEDLAQETWKYGLIPFQCVCENTWALPLYLTSTTQDGIVPCLSALARCCAWGDVSNAVLSSQVGRTRITPCGVVTTP